MHIAYIVIAFYVFVKTPGANVPVPVAPSRAYTTPGATAVRGPL